MYESVESELRELFSIVLSTLPELIGATLLILIGWLLGKFLRMVIVRIIRSFNHFFAGRFRGHNLEFVHIPKSIQTLLGGVAFWATLLVFITVGVRVVGLTSAATWLERMVVYLPSLFAGGLIILGGFIVGAVMRKLVVQAASAAEMPQPQWLGQIAQTTFIGVALVIGLGQIGIDVTFLIILVGIVLAAVLAGFAIAFGFGAQKLVANLVANQHLKQLMRPGQHAQIGEIRGQVLEFTPTGVWLETPKGRSYVPAKTCMEQHLTVFTEERGNVQ